MGGDEVSSYLFIVQSVHEGHFWYLGIIIFCSDLGTIDLLMDFIIKCTFLG